MTRGYVSNVRGVSPRPSRAPPTAEATRVSCARDFQTCTKNQPKRPRPPGRAARPRDVATRGWRRSYDRPPYAAPRFRSRRGRRGQPPSARPPPSPSPRTSGRTIARAEPATVSVGGSRCGFPRRTRRRGSSYSRRRPPHTERTRWRPRSRRWNASPPRESAPPRTYRESRAEGDDLWTRRRAPRNRNRRQTSVTRPPRHER